MRTHVQKSARLGDLVVAAFDEAARFSSDPREVSRLATQAVGHMLRGAQKRKISLSRPTMRITRVPLVDGGQARLITAETNIREIRNAACSLLLSRCDASPGVTEGECCDDSDHSQDALG
jgi:hypothetical protein